MDNVNKIKKVHIIGIGGIGVSALATLLLHRGCDVSGSDLENNQNIEKLIKLGAKINIGPHRKENVPSKAEVVIYSSAIPATNPERQQAGLLGIDEFDYHEFLGRLTEETENIVVTGTHGKSTTTALLGVILSHTSLDPTVIVGANLQEFDGNLKIGKSDNYLIEGDEYQKGILELHPALAILTNIEHDHFDIYPTQADYIEVFQDFVNKLPSDGYLIYNFDDKNINNHIVKPSCNVASYSLESSQAALYAKNFKVAHGRQIFRLVYKGQELKDFNIKLPGKYNIYNALAATLAALELGVDQDIIKDSLASFQGLWRRFEEIGEINGAKVISDYAHHPTELKSVVQAVKEFYPDKKITAYFQPHQINRTKNLLNEFAEVIDQLPVDKFYLNEIYDVAGRSEDASVSSQDIIKNITKTKVVYVPNLQKGIEMVADDLTKDNVLLLLGAGSIDKVFRDFLN